MMCFAPTLQMCPSRISTVGSRCNTILPEVRLSQATTIQNACHQGGGKSIIEDKVQRMLIHQVDVIFFREKDIIHHPVPADIRDERNSNAMREESVARKPSSSSQQILVS